MWNPFRNARDQERERDRAEARDMRGLRGTLGIEARGSTSRNERVGPRYDLGDRNPSQGFTGGYGGGVAPRHDDDAGGSYAASHFPRDTAGTDHTGRGPRGWQRDDSRIEEDVCETLTRHPLLDASHMEVRVEQGEVTLSGTVEDRDSRRLAEDVAASCRGVHDVHNRLRTRRSRYDEITSRLGNVHG